MSVRVDDVLVPPGWPEGSGALFTTRHGGAGSAPYATLNLSTGVSDAPDVVAENRRRLARLVGVPDERLLFMRQVHGADVATVNEAWPRGTGSRGAGSRGAGSRGAGSRGAASPGAASPGAGSPQVDAMVTTARRLALSVLVADCVPVLLADPARGVVGAAHAGRAGMVAGVVPATVERMRDLGARDVVAVLGPAVCGSCYELSAELADAVAREVPAAAARTRDGTPAADVPAGVTAQLVDAGVRVLPWSPPCTVESPHQFSHRRDRVTGRTAGVIWLP